MSTQHDRRRFILSVIAGPLAGGLLGPPARAQGSGRVTGFDHVALPLGNVERMSAFYRDLGFRTESTEPLFIVYFGDQKVNFHMPAVWQREGFTLRGPTARPGCGDLCFVWEGTPESLRAALNRAGATIIEGPIQRVGGRDAGKATATSVYVRDPDQNLLEFMIYP